MRNVFFVVILMLFVSITNAQLAVSIGGGANFSNLKVKNLASFKPTSSTNYFISVKPEFILTENLCVAIDIQFSQKGFGFDANTTGSIDGYKFQYLDLIPQIQYKLIKQLAIYGGLGVGIRGSEKYKIKDVWEEAVIKISRGTEFTYVLGIRIFPTEKLSINAQYAGGLSSFFNAIFTDSQGNPIENVDTNLRNFQVGIGYQLF